MGGRGVARSRKPPIGGSAGQFGMVATRFPAGDRAQFLRVFNTLPNLATLASFGIIDPVELRNLRERPSEHGAIQRRKDHISTSHPTASRKSDFSWPLCSVFWRPCRGVGGNWLRRRRFRSARSRRNPRHEAKLRQPGRRRHRRSRGAIGSIPWRRRCAGRCARSSSSCWRRSWKPRSAGGVTSGARSRTVAATGTGRASWSPPSAR